jgi:hypothetical protein
MNYIRQLVFEGQERLPFVEKVGCRRDGARESTLLEITIPRRERRLTDQRREDRYRGIIGSAVLRWRGANKIVTVVNVSASGLMVETECSPRIGEKVGVRISGADPLVGYVRWVREGRFGIDFGEPAIQLIDEESAVHPHVSDTPALSSKED